jgi:glycosyltransferase involved in cell wall biosynthesis
MRERIAVLLSTYDGAPYLGAQLASLLAQTCPHWTLLWRDDGSQDETLGLMAAWMRGAGQGRCREVGPPGRLGPTPSFMTLLRAAGDADLVAFADQDDVWLPDKLARAAAALGTVPPGRPALYCARQLLVDAGLGRLGMSAPIRPLGFPAALTQNVATGCTVMMNRAAAQLVAASEPPSTSLHDWWSYLVVAAVGGRLVADPAPVVLYRQHATNLVGAPQSARRRAAAALRRGPGVFMHVLREHVAALRAQPGLVAPENRAVLERIHHGLASGPGARFTALLTPGLRRQTWQETLLFRLWFMTG